MADCYWRARSLSTHILEPELDRLSSAGSEILLVADHKSRLQELLRASGRPEPRYELVGEAGPAHRKSFTMQVIVMNSGNEADFSPLSAPGNKKSGQSVGGGKGDGTFTGHRSWA